MGYLQTLFKLHRLYGAKRQNNRKLDYKVAEGNTHNLLQDTIPPTVWRD
jgi:hypothetical protein